MLEASVAAGGGRAPRAAAARGDPGLDHPALRLTPAGAGRTTADTRLAGPRAADPRRCGEDLREILRE
ncbi:hypothetical protein, partial [Streptomyces sp. BE20]|uniref:hypothetical protein n=1 Tax=Streptomyces sp. BE20 TaxID=3002525 RepID=UPI002E7A8E6E